MLKKLIFLGAILMIVSCNNSNDFFLTGNVSGLKKGKLYLQRVDDTTLVTLDSLEVSGDPEFAFEAQIKEPQVLYLNLEKKDGSDYDDRILFFAEPGEMTLTTSLKNFERQAAITGSENQLKLDEYKKMIMKFNDQNLDLIKKSFEAQQQANEDSLVFYDKKMQNLVRRKYLYTVNFALNNKNLEVAPYLAVSEIFDANVKYLDTIYNALESNIRKSKYGKTLKGFIKERKNTDKHPENVEVAKQKEVPMEVDSIE
ncbi:MAG TPA: DUF4369 domain-containing protein [Leeuwenhoekiella sp.]|nr:DUF4369 domain-containing protein [Leeuwenhoekiella sp.]